MNCLVKRMFNVAFLTVIIAGTAATASAQQANFHLPYETTWGSMVLPPGDYTVRLPQPSLGTQEVTIRGPVTGFIMVTARDTYGERKAAPANDFLQLVKVGDMYFVTKYEEASMDVTLFFKAPKQTHAEQASARTMRIPVKGS
jgi:hypothetical protein